MASPLRPLVHCFTGRNQFILCAEHPVFLCNLMVKRMGQEIGSSYPEGNFRWNQLLGGSIGLSPLCRPQTTRFARQDSYHPPPQFPMASVWTGKVRRLSGLTALAFAQNPVRWTSGPAYSIKAAGSAHHDPPHRTHPHEGGGGKGEGRDAARLDRESGTHTRAHTTAVAHEGREQALSPHARPPLHIPARAPVDAVTTLHGMFE